jgi:hypothetical protein
MKKYAWRSQSHFTFCRNVTFTMPYKKNPVHFLTLVSTQHFMTPNYIALRQSRNMGTSVYHTHRPQEITASGLLSDGITSMPVLLKKMVNWLKKLQWRGWNRQCDLRRQSFSKHTKISNTSHLILHHNQSIGKPVTITWRESWYCTFHQT